MKKAICVVLSILMLFTLQVPAMAQGASNRLEPINADTNSLICKAEDIMGVGFDRASITTEKVSLVGREYLGWSDTVLLVNTHQFQEYFWPRVGTKAIQALAVDAANSVPGSGTTPIRFWGDASYNGRVG